MGNQADRKGPSGVAKEREAGGGEGSRGADVLGGGARPAASSDKRCVSRAALEGTPGGKGKAEGCMGLPSSLLIFTLMIGLLKVPIQQASTH